ncbi:MAG TPA: hypothetical protein VIU82_26000 [Bosea sp. (in: a-proteobacteria)]
MVNIIGRRVGIQDVSAPAADNSLGKVLGALGTKLFGDTLTPALKREQMQKIADENEMRKAYVDSTGADGINSNPRITSLAAALGTIDPNALGRMRALEAARIGGVDSPVAAAALTGLGQFTSTPEHQRRTLGNNLMLKDREEQTKMALAANLPETILRPDATGAMVPTVVPRSESYGAPAVTSLDQQKALAAGPAMAGLSLEQRQQLLLGRDPARTPRNYVANGQSFVTYDGVTRADGSGPLPPGGTMAEITGSATEAGLRPNVQGALQQTAIDRGRFKSMVDFTRNIAVKDPTLFGLPGQIRRLGQEGLQLANGLAQTFGASDINSAKSAAIGALQGRVNPKLLSELFDPNLPALQSASNLLVYQAASALAGQQGRSVTDKDLVVFRNIAGDPNSMFESQQSYLTRLQTMEDMVEMMAGSDQRISGQQMPGGAQPQGAPQQIQAPVPRQMQTRSGATVTIERVQ